MLREWQRDVQQATATVDTLTPANQIVLAYQFNKETYLHPDGFTMDLFGNLHQPEEGYAVGMTPVSFPTAADALSTLAGIQEQWGFRNLYLGYWRDPADGRDYIDVVMVTRARELAERLGIAMGQRAIYSFSDGADIRLDGKGL